METSFAVAIPCKEKFKEPFHSSLRVAECFSSTLLKSSKFTYYWVENSETWEKGTQKAYDYMAKEISKMRNKGLDEALKDPHDYIVLFDDDIQVPFDFFERILMYPTENFLTARILSPKGTTWRIVDRNNQIADPYSERCDLPSQVWILKQKWFESLNPRPKFWADEGHANEDYNFARQFLALGHSAFVLPVVCRETD